MESEIDISSPKNTSIENTSPTKDKTNNGWTEKKEKLLKYWQEECRLYVWLHNKNSTYYRQLNRILTLPAILITATTSTALFSTIGSSSESENSNNDKIIAITFGILLIIGAFLQSAREFLDIEKQIQRNTNSSISYQGIVNEIEVQLTQDTQDRSDGKLFLQKIKNSKNDIVRNGPSISSGTWDQLKLGIRNGDVINLYGTSFFQDYIANLDNIDKDINSNANQKQEVKMPRSSFSNVLRSSNGPILKSLRNETDEEDRGRHHFSSGMGQKTVRYQDELHRFNNKKPLENNSEVDNGIFIPMEDFSIKDNNIEIPSEDVVITGGMDDTGIDLGEYVSITPTTRKIITRTNPTKTNNRRDSVEIYSDDDKDVEDSFQSNMGMQQIQQNLSIPIGDKKYKNRTGLLNYQLGRL
jgi:hypothetical protein